MAFKRLATSLLIMCAVMACALAGGLRPIDDVLGDWRFAQLQRSPLGNTVFVDIDSKSLKSVGVWPWPRSIYAKLLDRLMDLGAANVVFDIDFSARSNPKDDQTFAAALDRAGGFATLAVFGQHSGAGEGYNLPLETFRANVGLAAVDVPLSSSGVVRAYDPSMLLDGHSYPTVGSVLAGRSSSAISGQFAIDFGIDAARLARISVADLLGGIVPLDRVSGKQIIVGASAVELRDLFMTPRFGIVPGAVLHQLAAETILQNRELFDLGFVPLAICLAVLGMLSVLLDARLIQPRWLIAATALPLVFEVVALGLQAGAGLLLHTAALHFALALLTVRAAILELAARRKDQLRSRRERDRLQTILRRVVADNFDGILIVDRSGKILLASALAENLLGAGLLGRSTSDVLPEDLGASLIGQLHAPDSDAVAGERALGSKTIEYAFTVSREAAGEDAALVGCFTFRDISERRRAEERLRFLADHDPLTGAWSRSRLVEHVSRMASTIALVDLKRFNLINETLGHSVGDQVLKEVVQRLRGSGAQNVARVGGDSFVVVLDRVFSVPEIETYCDQLISAVAAPYGVGPYRALVGVSVGVTTSDISGRNPQFLLSNAATAQAKAKLLLGNGSVLFDHDMEVVADGKRKIELDLRIALANDELSVAYQPQFELKSGRLVGAEALIRWHRADGTSVPPSKFITIAEETGLICELGAWVMGKACADAAKWPPGIKLAVNVSPVQFELSDVPAMIDAALKESALPASRLDIEITEGVFASSIGLIEQTLGLLRRKGVGIALDDFGTGYSSLGYISRMPIDKLKIDQSFVRGLPENPDSVAIVRSVLLLAQSTNKRVIAEGIETEAQLSCLVQHGCDIGQGYLLGRPGDASLIPTLRSRGRTPHESQQPLLVSS